MLERIKPDWHWQDIPTVPNAISIAGYLCVRHGLQQGADTPKGIAYIGVGRTFDLLDGHVARRTGQSSQLGATIDATLDKKGMQEIHGTLQEKGMLDTDISRAIAGQNMANGVITTLDKILHPGKELSPSKAGKHSMAETGLYFGSTMLAVALKNSGHHRLSRGVRYLGFAFGIDSAFRNGPQATNHYAKRLFSGE